MNQMTLDMKNRKIQTDKNIKLTKLYEVINKFYKFTTKQYKIKNKFYEFINKVYIILQIINIIL